MTARSNGDSFIYDANGNMTSRTQSSVTWTQVFDAENRLVSVGNSTSTTTYVYDGSGGRLKRIVTEGSTITTTLYVAGLEIETQKVGTAEPTETKRTIYYPSGGAFRVVGGENAGLYFRHSDHLGSTSVLSNASGLKVAGSDVVYAPFGEVRSGEQSSLTDFGYTGQRRGGSTGGLMYYGARYYLPGIQHFISADTIVPGPANPQAFNRYAYVLNNPVKMIDPTGHVVNLAPMIDTGVPLYVRPPRSVMPRNAPGYAVKGPKKDPVKTVVDSPSGNGNSGNGSQGGGESDPIPNVAAEMKSVCTANDPNYQFPGRTRVEPPYVGPITVRMLHQWYLRDYMPKDWMYKGPPVSFPQYVQQYGAVTNISGSMILSGPPSYLTSYGDYKEDLYFNMAASNVSSAKDAITIMAAKAESQYKGYGMDVMGPTKCTAPQNLDTGSG